MYTKHKGKLIAIPTAGALGLLSTSAMAAGGTDFSGILDGLSGATAVTAIVGAAAILALVAFAAWGARKVAGFFGR